MNFWQLIGVDIGAIERKAEEVKEQYHAHFVPSDEPLSWATRGRTVRLSTAVMAAHLMTARLIFGGVASIIDQATRIAGSLIKSKADDLAAAEIGTVLGIQKRTMAVITFLLNAFDENQVQIAKEKKIRKESLDAQRDVWKSALPQRKSKRKVRRVLTRHQTKKQRKANKKWRSPVISS